MRHINKLPIRIIIALVAAFLLAGAFTTITYSCAPGSIPTGESTSQCVAFEKAVMHPNDLFSNKQNSLIKFSTTFAITALVAFALLSTLNSLKKNKA